MLTSKQRAYLKSLANPLDTILMVGKGGVTAQVIQQGDEALEARELIKGKVLETASEAARETAEAIARAVNGELVQVIGSKFVLYRPRKKNPEIQLPPSRERRG